MEQVPLKLTDKIMISYIMFDHPLATTIRCSI